VLTRGQLIDRIWGSDYFGDTKTLDVHVKRLRTKLEVDPGNPRHLLTAAGRGYRFELVKLLAQWVDEEARAALAQLGDDRELPVGAEPFFVTVVPTIEADDQYTMSHWRLPIHRIGSAGAP